MAQRVATEYVNANIALPESEMPRLISICELQQLKMQVFVLENANQQVVLEDAGGETIRLTFENANGQLRCSLTCRVVQSKLTNALRKIVSTFKGDAVVNRIYPGFTMVYHYKRGAVVRIDEATGSTLKTVFEHHEPVGVMEARFKLATVEDEIARLRETVNELLDVRNQTRDARQVAEIDDKLKQVGRRLFALEA